MKIFKNRIIQGLMILIIFFIFIVLPGVKIGGKNIAPDMLLEFNVMQYGILHINSLCFIVFTAIMLFLSIDGDIKNASKMHSKKEAGLLDARNTFENYFSNKINLKKVFEKSKKNQSISMVLKIILNGGIEDDLTLGMQRIFTEISSKYIKLKNDYEYFSTVMPIVGMVGTIAGLLIMFATPTEVEDFENKFSGLSVALATTLYASMITVLIFKPKARGVEDQLVSLDMDYEYLEISVKQFFHKVDMVELRQFAAEEEVDNEKKV